MITRIQSDNARRRASDMFREAGFILSSAEIVSIDTADFGLGRLETEGAQIVPLADTDRLSLRLIALFPGQTEPEHWHTSSGGQEGKEEILRLIKGTLYFYLPGESNLQAGKIPGGKEEWYTCRNETVLKPGDQMIVKPGTRHWFQAGPEGAVMLCFCTAARDACDPFSDPSVVRVTSILE